MVKTNGEITVKKIDISCVDLLDLMGDVTFIMLTAAFKLKENKEEVSSLGVALKDRMCKCMLENNINEFYDVMFEATKMMEKVVKTEIPEKATGILGGIKDLFKNFKDTPNIEKVKKVVSLIDLFTN